MAQKVLALVLTTLALSGVTTAAGPVPVKVPAQTASVTVYTLPACPPPDVRGAPQNYTLNANECMALPPVHSLPQTGFQSYRIQSNDPNIGKCEFQYYNQQNCEGARGAIKVTSSNAMCNNVSPTLTSGQLSPIGVQAMGYSGKLACVV